MMASLNDFQEDEDVIIQGSLLHKHLSQMGYLDFESISVQKTCAQQQDVVKVESKSFLERVHSKLFSIYSWILQEDLASKNHLHVILNAETLLDDHMSMIHNFIQTSTFKTWLTSLQQLVAISTTIVSSTYLMFCNAKNIFSMMLASSAILTVSRIKYMRFCSQEDLQCLIASQNELHRLFKKGLKILKYGYKLKSKSQSKSTEQFHDLMVHKLCFLQLIIENIVKSIEDVSCTYYKISLIIIKLLPSNVSNEYQLTKFHQNSFRLTGQIDYQALMYLYNTYILVQSEMLYLLALAYDINTWRPTCSRIPEFKLVCIITILIKRLTTHKYKLKQVFEAYDDCTLDPVRYKFKGPGGSKWQDVYVHLDLTSHKLQVAYNQLLSIIKNIDVHVNDVTNENEILDVITEKMNQVYKDIDTAKNFAEFSTLLLAKIKFGSSKKEDLLQEITLSNVSSKLPIVIDSEPEIVDEVFEEYIKEEYINPLYEEADILSDENYKLDKLLVKNFMSELKEALIDKHKSMCERESVALERMYKKIVSDHSHKSELTSILPVIPRPPPMPPLNFHSIIENANEENSHKQQALPDKICRYNTLFQKDRTDRLHHEITSLQTQENALFAQSNVSSMQLPCVNIKPHATMFNCVPPFLKGEEETFIGSGENSEDENEANQCNGNNSI